MSRSMREREVEVETRDRVRARVRDSLVDLASVVAWKSMGSPQGSLSETILGVAVADVEFALLADDVEAALTTWLAALLDDPGNAGSISTDRLSALGWSLTTLARDVADTADRRRATLAAERRAGSARRYGPLCSL